MAGTEERLGVQVAADDFGTGYSSLAYLRRLPIDVLKVDRSFVHNAVRDSVDAKIVRTIVALARALRLRVVAEGVEPEDQAEFLRSSGCEQAQGNLYAKPMPAGQVRGQECFDHACSKTLKLGSEDRQSPARGASAVRR